MQLAGDKGLVASRKKERTKTTKKKESVKNKEHMEKDIRKVIFFV